MNERSLIRTRGARLLRTNTPKRNVLVRDRDILRRKRAELAEIAFDLFVDRGFHCTGIRDIAAAAGLSVGSVFTYFTDKEEILAHIFFEQLGRTEKELLGTLRMTIARETGSGQAPEAVFDAIFTQFLTAVDKLRRFILLAYQETKSLNAAAREALIGREKRVQALIAEAIRYGAQHGRFAPDDIELKAHNIVVLGHAWAIRHWMFADAMKSIDEYRDFLRPLIYSMLEIGAAAGIRNKGRRRATGAPKTAGANREKAPQRR
jgi:TetR/AcrR family transcriptional regulator, cholesterol catabolism regulator